jgi:hypothetical protein
LYFIYSLLKGIVLADNYDDYSKEELIRELRAKNQKPRFGLYWERDDIEHERAINNDFVALDLDESLSYGNAPYQNLIIEGDNFDALRYLRMTYKGKVQCIYIDPPYNTGNKDFVYNDRFIDKDDVYKHSKWLEFMYRRLAVARDLLAEDGVIFVSIGDNEQANLKLLMDDVFGESKRLTTFIWRTDGNFDNQAKIKSCHEYILMYAASPENFLHPNVVDPSIGDNSKLNKPFIRNTIVKNGHKNPISEVQILAGFPADFENGIIPARTNQYPHYDYDLIIKDGRLANDVIAKTGWSSKSLLINFIESGFMPMLDTKGQKTRFVITSTGAIESIKERDKPSHVISVISGVGTTQSQSVELINMGCNFSFPKPVELIKYLISIHSDKDSIVLDFFAGSGTTAHAVLNLNKQDGGNRRYILVSNTEATETEPDKNLCRDVCAERVRRVMLGYTNQKAEQVEGLGGNFAYLKTRRIAADILLSDIEHAQIWTVLQLSHGAALSAFNPNSTVQQLQTATEVVMYCCKLSEQELTAITDCLQTLQSVVVYCWQPALLAQYIADENLTCLPIPQILIDRFGTGVKA